MAQRWLLVLLAAAACGPRTGAALRPLAPRDAVVGLELKVVLHADAPGAQVGFDFASDIADLKSRRLRPTLQAFGGEAVFRWTPLARDVGTHALVFYATVDDVASSVRLEIEVLPGDEPIVFRAPVGEGTTLDLAQRPCAEVDILVEDAAADRVELSEGPTWTGGGVLSQSGPFSGRLEFCPAGGQVRAESVFPFSFVASDARGESAEKRYVIVLGTLPPGGP
jgi:hypothetical protein